MYVRVALKPTSNRVQCDVFELVAEVGCIADAVIVKSGLPNLTAKFCANLVRESSLDALRAAFDGLTGGRGEQDV